MTRSVRDARRKILIAALAALAAGGVHGQTYPAKPVRMVVPFAAGGSVDVVARVLAQKFGSALGQQFIVDNKPGANGNIGTELVARAPADGYTLLIGPDSNLTVNPLLFPGLGLPTTKDLTPVSLLTKIGVGLIVNPAVPATTVAEYLAYARTLSNGLSFGSPGTGTPHHLAGELLKQVAGVSLVHIPYKGGGPAMIDLLGNQVPSAFIALAIAAPHIKSGKLRLLAVTQATRSENFPATPTLGETVKGFDVTSWMGLFVPVGTPPDIVQRLNAEIRKALQEPATAQSLGAQSLEVVASTPTELGERIAVESERWANGHCDWRHP